MSTDNRLRQPAGIPVGGQFAPDLNSTSAAPVDLGPAHADGCECGCGGKRLNVEQARTRYLEARNRGYAHRGLVQDLNKVAARNAVMGYAAKAQELGISKINVVCQDVELEDGDYSSRPYVTNGFLSDGSHASDKDLYALNGHNSWYSSTGVPEFVTTDFDAMFEMAEEIPGVSHLRDSDGDVLLSVLQIDTYEALQERQHVPSPFGAHTGVELDDTSAILFESLIENEEAFTHGSFESDFKTWKQRRYAMLMSRFHALAKQNGLEPDEWQVVPERRD